MRALPPQLRSPPLHQPRRLGPVVAVSSVPEPSPGRRDSDERAVVGVSYAQTPVGWWQDAKGTMQPPGSFLTPSRRLSPEGDAVGTGGTRSARSRLGRWTSALL